MKSLPFFLSFKDENKLLFVAKELGALKVEGNGQRFANDLSNAANQLGQKKT